MLLICALKAVVRYTKNYQYWVVVVRWNLLKLPLNWSCKGCGCQTSLRIPTNTCSSGILAPKLSYAMMQLCVQTHFLSEKYTAKVDWLSGVELFMEQAIHTICQVRINVCEKANGVSEHGCMSILLICGWCWVSKT